MFFTAAAVGLVALTTAACAYEGVTVATGVAVAMTLFMGGVAVIGISELLKVRDLVLDDDGLRIRTGLSWTAEWQDIPLDGLQVEHASHEGSKGGTLVAAVLTWPQGTLRFSLLSGRSLLDRETVIREGQWLVDVLRAAAQHPDEPTRVLRAYAPTQ